MKESESVCVCVCVCGGGGGGGGSQGKTFWNIFIFRHAVRVFVTGLSNNVVLFRPQKQNQSKKFFLFFL